MVNNLGFNSACRTMNNNIHKDHDQSNKKPVSINKIRILSQSSIKISVAYLTKKKNYLIL